MSPVATSLTTLRSTLAHRRSARRDHQQLERELSSYASASDRLDLVAILERHTPEEIAPIVNILDRQPRLQRVGGLGR
jgi:hypothetical protein